jgi:hypothetical protein
MAQHRDGALGNHCQRLHVRREGIDLGAVYFVASEGTRERVNRDVLRLDIAGGLKNLLIEARSLDFAATRRGAQHRIFAEQGQNMQAVVGEFRERGGVMLNDRCQADVQLVHVILGAEIKRRPYFGERPKPILAYDVCDVLRQFKDTLPGAAFT